MNESSNYNFDLTRNQIITRSYKKLGIPNPTPEQIEDAAIEMNSILKNIRTEGIDLFNNKDLVVPFQNSDGVIIDTTAYDCAKRHTSAADGVLRGNTTTLSMNASTKETFDIGACKVRIAGANVTKAAETGLVFSSAYTINTGGASVSYWGVFAVQINASGVISTKAPVADQVYPDEATAKAVLPAADSANIVIGYITVNVLSGNTWTANTDDLDTDGTGYFYNTTEEVPVYSNKPGAGSSSIAYWELKGIEEWVTGTSYSDGDQVIQNSLVYECETAHTSGTFSTDLASAYWTQVTRYGAWAASTNYETRRTYHLEGEVANVEAILTRQDSYQDQVLEKISKENYNDTLDKMQTSTVTKFYYNKDQNNIYVYPTLDATNQDEYVMIMKVQYYLQDVDDSDSTSELVKEFIRYIVLELAIALSPELGVVGGIYKNLVSQRDVAMDNFLASYGETGDLQIIPYIDEEDY